MEKLHNAFCCFFLLLFFSMDPLPLVSQSSRSSAVDLYTTGVESQSEEDWYTASQYFREALQINPAFADAWFHLAQCAYQLEQYDLAVEYSNTAEKYTADNAQILNLRGMAFISLGKLADARTVFEKILVSYPNDIDARFGLAELDLFDGRLSGAEKKFEDALRRQGTNRKVLLSLALISAEMGKNDIALKYINQAIQYHSGEAEVHYLASYLAARRGDWGEAEHYARAAVQINGNYDKAYALLASILYSQRKYDDVIDICDFRIGRDRNCTDAWYMKGLALYKLGKNEDALSSWSTGISVDPQDEIMRGALELLAEKFLPVEDSRRSAWAQYHIEKASGYEKKYQESLAHYEFQRALKLDPMNTPARMAYAEMLKRDGLNELYLEQLKFIQQNSDSAVPVTLNDKVEAYESLMTHTLAVKWNVKPFDLDKIRWRLGIYYMAAPVQLLHTDSERITAEMAADIFSGIATTSVDVSSEPVSGYADAYRNARAAGCDYFILVSTDENSREITLNASMFSARTGTKTADFSLFRTGNDRYADVLRKLRQNVLDKLPIRGKIIARDGNILLIDIGKSEGMVKGTKLAVIKKGELRTADTGPGIVYSDQSILGTLSVTNAGEEISEGILENKGFFDRVNIGDEVAVTALPEQKAQTVTQETAPAATAQGKSTKANTVPPSADSLGLKRTPALVDLIRNIY